jgi:hypothetical protein
MLIDPRSWRCGRDSASGNAQPTLSLPHPRRRWKLAAAWLGAQFGGRALSLPGVANSTASLAAKRLTGQRILRTNALEQLPG